MKIVLLGYGKMGKEIEKIALSRKHEIILKVDENNHNSITKEQLASGDVAIEFSTPHTVEENIYKCFNANLPIVVGTTGWYDNFEKITSDCKKGNHALFHATNFSVGVNLFFKVNKYLAELMNNYPDYNVSMEEIHHIHKLDTTRATTYEDKSITSEADREKHFWQKDHVRLFGLDYKDKLAAAGFKVTVDDFVNTLGADLVDRYRLPAGEMIYLCRKD